MPANTFIATLEAVTQAGARPVVVDVSERGLQHRSRRGRGARSRPRRGAIMPVHLYGQMADMRASPTVAERHGLAVIEDACQAHGAERDGIARRRGRHRCRVQLLPGQEPRRVRRRRGARRPTTTSSRHAFARCASTGRRAKYQPRPRRLHRAARHDPGASCCCGSCRCSTAGTLSGRPPPRSTPSARRRRRPRAPAGARRGATRSGTCTSSGRAIPRRLARSSASAASRRAGTIRSRCT